MNALLRLVFVFVFTLSGYAAAPSDETRSIQAEILRLEGVRMDALLKGDWPTLERLYADELIYVHSGGRIDTKKGYLGMLAGGNLTYVSLRYDAPQHIVVVGRDTAIASGTASIETKNRAGQLAKRVLATTTVYARSGTTWHIVSYQGTPVQP
jgi:ketosteroid isomerase-like protein